MIKPALQKPITIDSLQKYSIELEGYAHSLEIDYKKLEDGYQRTKQMLNSITNERDSIAVAYQNESARLYKLLEEFDNLKKEKESLYIELEVYKKIFNKILMSEMQLNTSEENGELYKSLSNAFDKLSKNLEGALFAMIHNVASLKEHEKENKEDE